MSHRQEIVPNIMLWFSFASLALLYSVMLLGIYVTASHQGLSCPNWPLCPNGFGIPSHKYFFEHMHRTTAIITAVVISVTAVYAIKKKATSVRKTAIAASITVAVQILLGMLIVTNKLEPMLVATHLSTGVLLFAMTLMTFISSYSRTKNNSYL